MSSTSTFQAPTIIRDQLVSELFTRAGTLNPDRIFAHIIDGDVDEPVVENVTWNMLLTQAHAIAVELSEKVQPRQLGRPPRTIGILARNGYSYVPHLLAALMNGWTVSAPSMCVAGFLTFFDRRC